MTTQQVNQAARVYTESLGVHYKGEKGRFASLMADEVISRIEGRFGHQYTVTKWLADKSHTKAAQKVGGGEQYRVTLRAHQPITLRTGDVVYPQITVRDRTYPGSALTVEFGLYRQICTNGLMGFRKVVEPVRVPHFRNREGTLMYLDRIIESSA